MVEVAIALGVSALVISAIVATVLSSLGTAQYNRDFNLATSYSQEGIEAARSFTDSTLNGMGYCLGTDLQPVKVCDSTANIDGYYLRTIDFIPNAGVCGNTLTKVTVHTKWSDGKCSGAPFCHESEISSCISNI